MPEKYIDIEGQRFRVGNGVKNSSSSILKNAARLVAVTAIATGCAGSILPIPTEGAGPIATPISRDAEPSPTSSPTLTPETEVTARPTETVIPTVVPEATATAVPINPEYRLDGPEGFGGVDINGEFLSEEQRVEANKQWEPYIPYIEKMIEAGHYSGFVGVDNPTGISAAVRVLDDGRVVVYPKVVGGEKDGTIILPMGAYFDMKGIKVPEMTDGWDSRNVTELSKGTGERAYYESDFLTVVRADSEGNVFETWNHSEGRWVEVRSGLFQLTENDFREMREAVERDATGVTAELHKQYGLVEIAGKTLEIPSESRNIDIKFYASEALIEAMATSGLRPGYLAANPIGLMEAYMEAESRQGLLEDLLTPYKVDNNEMIGNVGDRTMRYVVARGVESNESGDVTSVGGIEIFELPNDFKIDMVVMPMKDLVIYQGGKPVSDDKVFWMIPDDGQEVRVGGVMRVNDETISPIIKNRISRAMYYKDNQGMPILADPIADSVTHRMWSFYTQNHGRLTLMMGVNEQSVLNPSEVNRTSPLPLFLAYTDSLQWLANVPAMAGFSGGGNMTREELDRWLKAGSEVYAQGFEDSCPSEYGEMQGRLRLIFKDVFGEDGSSLFLENSGP